MDYFYYKNGPDDLVRRFFSSLDVETYILPICGPLCTLLGSILGCQNAPKQREIFFLVLLDYFSYKNRQVDLVRGLFSSLDIPLTCWPLSTFQDAF
jgi:hypothetical protein